MTDAYLKDKLQQYLNQLSIYYQSLQNKRQKYPNMKDSIDMVLNKIDLEASYFEDQLNEIQTKQFTSERIKHKMTVVMNSYSKILDEIHKVLNFEPVVEIRRNEGKKRTKESKMREFVQELNSEWMLGVLNKNKENQKNRGEGENMKQKQKAKFKTKVDEEQKPKQKSRTSIALEHLKLQTKQLYQTMLRMKTTLSVHKHDTLNKQIQFLKQQERQLLGAVEDLKESNLLLKSQYQKLQKDLENLRRNRQIMMQDH